MDEGLGYPPAAARWIIPSDNRNFIATAFHSILAASGLRVFLNHGFDGKRKRLRPDLVPARSILWSEHNNRRAQLLSWPETDAIALIKQDPDDEVDVSVASNDLEVARKLLAEVEKLLPRAETSSETILPITFWHRSCEVPERTVRQIELARWSDIASNYVGNTRETLSRLMDGFRPATNSGRLLLWGGEPGTGKTFAIRALAWAWKDWCRFEYVIDPEQLLGNGCYLTEVALDRFEDHYLLEDHPIKDEWRLLIIEDSGEMVAMDSNNEVAQGLSRLLNLSDGILGQGTKILILVTTNKELGTLNPAIRRHGRCVSEVEFRRFNSDEATTWLRSAGCDAPQSGSRTLSELYAIRDGRSSVEASRKIGFTSERRANLSTIGPKPRLSTNGVSV
jgi:hypothetical protein